MALAHQMLYLGSTSIGCGVIADDGLCENDA